MPSTNVRRELEPHPHGEDIIELMEAHGYDGLYQTQQQAFEKELETGSHLLVAQTGNGKTLCAEYRIKRTLADNARVAYLVPSRSLKTEKEAELNTWCEGDVRVTGKHNDTYEHGDVVIATFEGFYQALLLHPAKVRDIDTVVLDDFHLLYDAYRGFNLEKVITLLMHNSIDIFAMSATIGKPEKIAAWLQYQDVTLTVSEEDRQVPIEEELIPRSQNLSIREQVGQYVDENEDQGPFLVFNKSKSDAEKAAEKIARARGWEPDRRDRPLQAYANTEETNNEDTETRTYQEEIEERVDSDLTNSLERLAGLLTYNVAYHHAGMPSELKQYIEGLFADGEIDAITLTTTLGSGYDAPVQTVIVADFKRWTGSTTEDIGVWEFEQWIGRAARPGYDHNRGYAAIVAKNEDRVEKYLAPREFEEITSQVRKNELLRKFLLELIVSGRDTRNEIEAIMQRTLWVHDQEDEIWGIEYDYEESLKEAAQWLNENNFIERKDVGFDATDLGHTAVRYGLQKYGRYSLKGIKQTYDWINSRGDIDWRKLTKTVCSAQNISLYKSDNTDMDDNFKQKMKDHGLDPSNKYAVTAQILIDGWIQNKDLGTVAKFSGYRVEYTRPVAQDVSEAYDLVERLIELSPDISVPAEFNTIQLAMEHGVTRDQARLVDEVEGLGRKRVRGIDEKLPNEFYESNDVKGMLAEIAEQRGEQGLNDWLLGNNGSSGIHGIGQKIATRIVNVIMDQVGDDSSDQSELTM